MKTRGALGNSRFSKKDVKPKEEVKPEAKKESEPKKEEKEDENKNKIPDCFEEIVVRLKEDGSTFKIDSRSGDYYNGRWLDGEKEGHFGRLAGDALKNKDLVEILSVKEKAPETEEQKEALTRCIGNTFWLWRFWGIGL